MDAGRPRQNWPMGMGYPSITWFFLTRQNQRSWGAVHLVFSFVLQLSPQSSPTASVLQVDFPGGSDGKASAYNAGDLVWEDLLEKEMATHSSILAWKIPRMEEPGGLQFMGSQRVRHN